MLQRHDLASALLLSSAYRERPTGPGRTLPLVAQSQAKLPCQESTGAVRVGRLLLARCLRFVVWSAQGADGAWRGSRIMRGISRRVRCWYAR